MGPSWADVERLIMTASGDQARDIRDYAILLLFANYALRSGEVAALRLEDLNWDREIIVVARPKQRRAQEYPLVKNVGEAIIRYLQQVFSATLRPPRNLSYPEGTVSAAFGRRLLPPSITMLSSWCPRTKCGFGCRDLQGSTAPGPATVRVPVAPVIPCRPKMTAPEGKVPLRTQLELPYALQRVGKIACLLTSGLRVRPPCRWKPKAKNPRGSGDRVLPDSMN